MPECEVVVGAGSLRSGSATSVSFPHRWTPAGVTVEAEFTGGHLLHLAAAGCVLNDVYREAERLGVPLSGVRVTAAGGFERPAWRSSGIEYGVEIDSPAAAADIERLLSTVDQVAEVPKAIRAGASVTRVKED
jgi:uncharacterized OsmC-like protein